MSLLPPSVPDSEATPTARLLSSLLPRHLWARDATAGHALAALIAALADQYDAVGADVDRLYDDLFIATCRARFVPYIGAGIGVVGLGPVSGPGIGDRAVVGRAIALRRRKGTLAAVGRGSTAATGWPALVQDGRSVTGHLQAVEHVDPLGGRLVDVAALAAGPRPRGATLARTSTRTASRTAGIGGRPWRPGSAAIDPGGAAYPTPASVQVALWRLQAFPIAGRTAHAVDRDGAPHGRAFAIHPLGIDAPLFQAGSEPADPSLAPTTAEMPRPLERAALAAALRARDGAPLRLRVAEHAGATPRPVGAEHLVAADLSRWRPPPHPGAAAFVDPVRGRVLLAAPAARVLVDATVGGVGEIGGGPYATPGDAAARAGAVTILPVAGGDGDVLSAALAAATAPEAAGAAPVLVALEDSASYPAPGGGWTLTLAAGAHVRIASATLAAPTLLGDLHVRLAAGSRLDLAGLLVGGTLTVEGGGTLGLEHCTIAPLHHHGLRARAAAGQRLSVTARFCVLGAVHAGPGVALALADTIAGHEDRAVGAPDAPVAELALRRATLLGTVDARTIAAEDCLLTAPLRAERGLVRTSYVAPASRVPAQLDCVLGSAHQRPLLTTTRWGDPAYGQLDLRCPEAIATAGRLGAEPGALSWLDQPARRRRLLVALGELLPAGLSASVDYRT